MTMSCDWRAIHHSPLRMMSGSWTLRVPITFVLRGSFILFLLRLALYDVSVRTLIEVSYIPEVRKNLFSLDTLDSLGYGN